ncbi:MAG: hypothetical protein GXO35_05110 [Gammaproteobacteria bacterium]|nr:hypothetical protein [Gammaproteobacteria bacterium]
MPGSSHEVDPSFMDALPLNIREPALDLIRFSSLKDMLEMRVEAPDAFLQDKYELSTEQWNVILNAVILTKISYFHIEKTFPNRYIDKLFEIAAFAYDMQGKNVGELYQALINEHPQMADWIKRALIVKQQNLKMAQART